MTDSTAEIFEEHRSLLFSIAYRMTSSVMDAEDIVQESYLRYLATNTDAVRSHKAYLCKITTRLCLDYLKSARVQRESYIGPWLPEPLQTADAPADVVVRKEMLSMAFLVLLEKLQPVERAIFLLRESFGYEYTDIAEIVEKSQANCRQIYSRAKRSLSKENQEFEQSAELQQQTVALFLAAVVAQDNDQLTAIISDEVGWWSDGGGKVSAATKPIFGREKVLKFIQGLMRRPLPNMTTELVEANGTPSLLLRSNSTLDMVLHFLTQDGQIIAIYAIRNPDKLRHIQ